MNNILLIIIMLMTCLAAPAQRRKVKQKEPALPNVNPVEAISEYKFKDAENYLVLAIEQLQK